MRPPLSNQLSTLGDGRAAATSEVMSVSRTAMRSIASLILLAIVLMAIHSSKAFATPPLYDRFTDEYLDTTKWRPGSFSTNIQSGYFEIARGTLNMSMRAYADSDGPIGSTDQSWSNLWLAADESLTAREIQSRIRVRQLSADACPRGNAATSFAEIQQRAFWFNDGTTRASSTDGVGVGDVYTNLSISRSSKAGDPINIFANVFHVTATGTDRIFSKWLGSVRNSTRPITLRTSWFKSRNEFHFLKYIPGESTQRTIFDYSSDVSAVARPAWRFNGKGLTLRAFPAYCARQLIYAEIDAVVEEVRVK